MIEISTQRQFVNALIASFGAMTIGMALGWMSPMLSTFPINETVETFLLYAACGVFFFAAIGALSAAIMTIWIDYRYIMIAYDVITIVSWIILISAKNSNNYLQCRSVQGLGVGGLSVVIPLYIGEISQPHVRGKLIAMFPVFIVIGILWSYIVGSMAHYAVFNISCGVWTIVHLVAVFFLPESPYVLLKKGKDEKANESMMKLRDGNPVNVTQELSLIKNEIEMQKTRSLSDIGNLKSLLIGFGCMLILQSNGIIALTYNMHNIISKTQKIDEAEGAVIIGVVQLIVTVLVASVMDKVSRRKMLLISIILTSLSMILDTTSVENFPITMKNGQMLLSVLLIITIATQFAVFSLGVGVVPWIIMGEIFSTKMKPYGTSLAAVTYWLFGLGAIEMVKENNSTTRTITVVVLGLLSALFVYFLVPETNNKSLGQIQSDLTSTQTDTTVSSNNAEA